jgi:hypothetical protein
MTAPRYDTGAFVAAELRDQERAARRVLAAQEVLEVWSTIERMRALVVEHRRNGDAMLAIGTAGAIRPHHCTLDRLAREIGLPPLTLGRDIAAFARAQLGLPIDAPSSVRTRPRTAAWERELTRAQDIVELSG